MCLNVQYIYILFYLDLNKYIDEDKNMYVQI
jgi:hypothetical protein